eukprot:TRINITY_DN15658_c0_g1_i1.p1 TRINITY_DN15658_c0_g1~~TRINITY_DN15658_c0_g1_i1.p1  ORF type:complete len:405 (-),score=112.94 TRINITY_DN15658_c0_g1_i1:20-1234(-)
MSPQPSVDAVVASDDDVEGCEEAMQLMAKADPDLDPCWGLLLGSAEGMGHGDTDVEDAPTVAEEAEAAADAQQLDQAAASSPSEDGDAGDCDGADDALRWRLRRSGDAASAKPISNVVDKAEVSSEMFPLAPCAAEPTVVRQDIKGCDAYILDNVLTPEECSLLMAQAEGHWSFWESDPERPRVAFRNAYTVELTHQELADRIWRRVGALVNPSVVLADEDDPRFEVDIEGGWVPYAMNANVLLSKYSDGGHFSPHTDGTTVVDFNRRTFYSCVLFLNESPWGGHTRIYDDAQMGTELRKDEAGRLTGDPSLILEEVPPKAGRMLVFYHRLMHEGVPAAEKYIIRTDVLYRRDPEQCTAPEDVEAFRLYQEAQLLAERGDCDEAATLFRRAFRTSPALRRVYRS